MKIEGIESRINQNGRVVIPAVMRRGMGLGLGDTVILSLEGGVLRMEAAQKRGRVAKGEPDEAVARLEAAAADEPASAGQEAAQGEAEDWLG